MDYDGRERTLEVFDADAHEQLALRTRLRPLLNELEVALGGSIVIIFHTRRETARLYSDITKNLNDAVFRGRMRRN